MSVTPVPYTPPELLDDARPSHSAVYGTDLAHAQPDGCEELPTLQQAQGGMTPLLTLALMDHEFRITPRAATPWVATEACSALDPVSRNCSPKLLRLHAA